MRESPFVSRLEGDDIFEVPVSKCCRGGGEVWRYSGSTFLQLIGRLRRHCTRNTFSLSARLSSDASQSSGAGYSIVSLLECSKLLFHLIKT